MFNRSDEARRPGGRLPVAAVVAVMLLAPLMAWPTVSTDVPQAPAAAPAPHLARPAGDFQIRCWQHGRLLFEQNNVTLQNASEYGLRLAGKDRNGRPLYVAETQNATCLVRPEAERPGAPLNGLR